MVAGFALTLTRLFELADGIAKTLDYSKNAILSRNPKLKGQRVDVKTLDQTLDAAPCRCQKTYT